MATVIDKFVNRWPREMHFWLILAEAASSICEDGIKGKLKLKCSISCRAKSQDSLRGSIERRQKAREKDYASPEEIEEDMIDLSGVRITLAFPGDVEEVKKFLLSYFGTVEERYWGLDENGTAVERKENGRFIGYRATHFLVKWKTEEDPSRFKTTKEHVGRTVEIQVTSIIMNAWQEAHHDLVYKQLNGTPSEEERNLIDMINGIAHAGEVALVQLQNCLKRRVETEDREFLDQYEVGMWLKSHIWDILDVASRDQRVGLRFEAPTYLPNLQRSGTLFDVLRIFRVVTPMVLRQFLTADWGTETKMYPGTDIPREVETSVSTGADIERWSRYFSGDPTDWAIYKICTWNCADIWSRDNIGDIPTARLRAFCCINSINFALSKASRRSWIRKILEDIFNNYTHKGEEDIPIRSLYALLSNDTPVISEFLSSVDIFWKDFLQVMVSLNSSFLRMALALSFSGVVVMPARTYADFIDGKAPRFVIWPGRTRNELFTQTVEEVTISQLPSGPKYLLSNLRWIRTQVSLEKIATGDGWCQQYAPPLNVLDMAPLPQSVSPAWTESLNTSEIELETTTLPTTKHSNQIPKPQPAPTILTSNIISDTASETTSINTSTTPPEITSETTSETTSPVASPAGKKKQSSRWRRLWK
jgi:ppGpp synthetase/RelA/SpoT-type nucleotidyltranferase